MSATNDSEHLVVQDLGAGYSLDRHGNIVFTYGDGSKRKFVPEVRFSVRCHYGHEREWSADQIVIPLECDVSRCGHGISSIQATGESAVV